MRKKRAEVSGGTPARAVSDENSGGSSAAAGDGKSPQSPLTDVRNVLGFLLAGFGAVLSFIGLRSTEVTTVLRNEARQASLIALLLLLGVLAAVLAVAIDNNRKMSWLSAAAIAVMLIGLGALFFVIPRATLLFGLPWRVSPWIGSVLLALGLVILAARPKHFWAGGASPGTGSQVSGVQPAVILIVAGVVFIAAATYGALRLESASQSSFSAQVGARISMEGSLATASVNVVASKIVGKDWIIVFVNALPTGTPTASLCRQVHVNPGQSQCVDDPCFYFDQARYANLHAQCVELVNGAIVPNASGDVNETLSVPFSAAKYRLLDIRAYVCAKRQICKGSSSGTNSRLDYLVPAAPAK